MKATVKLFMENFGEKSTKKEKNSHSEKIPILKMRNQIEGTKIKNSLKKNSEML